MKISTDRNIYKYNNSNGIIVPLEIYEKYGSNNQISNISKSVFDENAIINHLKHNVGQLTLIVDEMCNMRCKYCIYSGEYDNTRTHNYNKMNFDVAQKAIDNYIASFLENQKYTQKPYPVIGFYGGEPLLNKKLIRKCIDYIQNRYDIKVLYTITTNATLLTPDFLDFLVANEVHLCISINGDVVENDRLRVFSDGSGTYSSILKKLDMIHKLHPDFLNNCSISCTIDTGTNLSDLNKIFESDEFYGIKLSRVSAVSPYFSNWYLQYDEDDKKSYKEQYNKLRKIVVHKIINNLSLTKLERAIFIPQYISILNRVQVLQIGQMSNFYNTIMGNCIPGEKIAVNPSGDYLMCEKVNYSRNIGNVYQNISIESIMDLITEFNERTSRCATCDISRLCSMCYATTLNNCGKIELPTKELCSKQKQNIKELLEDIYKMLEHNNNIYTYCGLSSNPEVK